MFVLNIYGHLFRVIYGYDRVTLWFDRSDLPISLKAALKPHCRRLKVNVRQMKNHPLWKFKMRVFQPSPSFFRTLLAGITGVRVLISYIEIARDIQPDDPAHLPILRAAFLGCATIPRLRLPAVRLYKQTCYYARAHRKGRKRRDVPVMYADKPSKQPRRGERVRRAIRPDDPKCLHQEWRRHRSADISELGISSIADLLAFDFEAFFKQRMPFRKLPDSQTQLGRLLPGKRRVNDDSRRKRARQFMADATLKSGFFVLHNAVRAAPSKFVTKLERMTLDEWLHHAMERGSRWR